VSATPRHLENEYAYDLCTPGCSGVVICILLFAGCSTSSGGSSALSTPSAQASPSASVSGGVSIPPDAVGVVSEARADAARRTGISEDAWVAERVEARDWPDASLGCPQPGMNYSQVVTPGYLIVLRSGSRALEYHSGGHHAVYCGG
jgi:hypothetical protein